MAYIFEARGGRWTGWKEALGVGLGLFFVEFRGRVGVRIRGMVGSRGENLIEFWGLFIKSAFPSTPEKGSLIGSSQTFCELFSREGANSFFFSLNFIGVRATRGCNEKNSSTSEDGYHQESKEEKKQRYG